MLEYQDATDHPDHRVDYPEYVEGFEALGFERVGRVLAVLSEGSLEDLADGFGDQAVEFIEHATIPTPILRSPDRAAFTEVSWFWDSPSVRIRTTLDDGSLVETLRRWEVPPPAGPMAEYWRIIDIDQKMTASHNPTGGRSIEVVAECTPAQQWQRHSAHVARCAATRGAQPIDHADLATSLEQLHSTFGHATAVARSYTGWWKPLVYGYAGIGFLSIAVLVVLAFTASARGGTGWPYMFAAIAVAILFAFFTMPFVRFVISRVRSTPERFRPDLIAPEQAE